VIAVWYVGVCQVSGVYARCAAVRRAREAEAAVRPDGWSRCVGELTVTVHCTWPVARDHPWHRGRGRGQASVRSRATPTRQLRSTHSTALAPALAASLRHQQQQHRRTATSQRQRAVCCNHVTNHLDARPRTITAIITIK